MRSHDTVKSTLGKRTLGLFFDFHIFFISFAHHLHLHSNLLTSLQPASSLILKTTTFLSLAISFQSLKEFPSFLFSICFLSYSHFIWTFCSTFRPRPFPEELKTFSKSPVKPSTLISLLIVTHKSQHKKEKK